MADRHPLWAGALDDNYVECLSAAMQQAIVDASTEHRNAAGETALPAPEVTTALLSLAATLLEEAPAAATPSGMRKTAEAAGKHLHMFMREVRRIREADAQARGTIN